MSKATDKKTAEIEYIIKLLKEASPEKVHKMFIACSESAPMDFVNAKVFV